MIEVDYDDIHLCLHQLRQIVKTSKSDTIKIESKEDILVVSLFVDGVVNVDRRIPIIKKTEEINDYVSYPTLKSFLESLIAKSNIKISTMKNGKIKFSCLRRSVSLNPISGTYFPPIKRQRQDVASVGEGFITALSRIVNFTSYKNEQFIYQFVTLIFGKNQQSEYLSMLASDGASIAHNRVPSSVSKDIEVFIHRDIIFSIRNFFSDECSIYETDNSFVFENEDVTLSVSKQEIRFPVEYLKQVLVHRPEYNVMFNLEEIKSVVQVATALNPGNIQLLSIKKEGSQIEIYAESELGSIQEVLEHTDHESVDFMIFCDAGLLYKILSQFDENIVWMFHDGNNEDKGYMSSMAYFIGTDESSYCLVPRYPG